MREPSGARVRLDASDARLARWSAAALTLAAGALHLGQVRVHFDEDWTFGAFFLVVGVLQVTGGLYLVRPLGRRRLARALCWFGVVGSVLTVAIWLISRAFGLPFGAEPGARESIGLADAAADLFEIFGALLLLIWLRRDTGRRATGLASAGVAAALALLAAWVFTRSAGIFDPDPRLVTASSLVDVTALTFLVIAGLLFAGLPQLPFGPAGRPSTAALSILGALLIAASALTAFTLPARGGQNRDCAYGPLADDSGLTHAQTPEPIRLAIGESRSAVILILVACTGRPIELLDVRPLALTPRESSAPIRIVGSTLEPSRAARSAWVAPRGAGPAAPGAVLTPGTRYPLAIDVLGIADGQQALAAMTIEYRDGLQRGSMNFATVVRFVVGSGQE